MCGYVPGEVLRQCSTANPDEKYLCPYIVYGGPVCKHTRCT